MILNEEMPPGITSVPVATLGETPRVLHRTEWCSVQRMSGTRFNVPLRVFPLLVILCLVLAGAGSARTLRLVDSNVISDPGVSIPLVLDSEGNENALSLSLAYDPAVLAVTGLEPGRAIRNALWLLNTNTLGRIGLTIGLPGGERFQLGSNHLGSIRFLPLTPSGQAEIRFADSPIPRQIVSADIEPLASGYQQGRIIYGPRILRIAEASAVRSEPYEARIELIGSGEETAMGFSVQFDVQSVEYVGFRAADPNAVIVANTGATASGRVGFLLGLNGGRTFAAGTNEIVFLKFRCLATARDGRLEWGSDPVGLQVVNGLASPLATTYEGGRLQVGERRIRLLNTSGQVGNSVNLPVQLVGNGVENAVAFGIRFDPLRMRFESAQAGPRLDPGSVQINASGVEAGRLVVAVAAPLGTALPPGGNLVVLLRFLTFGGPGQTAVSIVADPIPPQVAGVTGTPFTAAAENALITLSLSDSPVIASQPAALEVRPGESAEFRVIAEGEGALSYQWRRNGRDLPSAASTTLTLANVQPEDAGLYSVQISNERGAIISREVPLSVLVSPSIARQPQPAVVLAGDRARLEVIAEGTAPLSYIWRKDGVPLPGQTRSFIEFGASSLLDAGNYQVTVNNRAGVPISSDSVRLTVLEAPQITVQPVSTTVRQDSAVVLRVAATGSDPLRYQWRLNGQNISGATGPVYAIASAALDHAGIYTVIVANDAGPMTSLPAELRVEVPPAPVGDNFGQATLIQGDSGAVSGSNQFATREGNAEPVHAGRTGGRSVWFRWRAPGNGLATFRTTGSSFDTLLAVYRGTDLSALTQVAADDDRGRFFSSQLGFNAVQGNEYVIALDAFNGRGGNYVLAWSFIPAALRVPEITRQPLSQTVADGAGIILDVTATDAQTYQWFFNGILLANQTQPSLRIATVLEANVGSYTVVVQGPGGQIRSEPAVVEIGPQPNVRSVDKPELAIPARGFQLQGKKPVVDPPGSAQALQVSFGATASQIYSTSEATTEQFEIENCSFVGGRTKWLLLRADRTATLLVQTRSAFETALSVRDGDSLEPLISECAALTHRLSLPVQAGRSYWLRTDSASEGAVSVDLVLGTAPVQVNQAPIERDLASGEELLIEPPASIAGNPALNYQWKRDGVAIPGATARQFRVSRPTRATRYSVVAGNALGSVEVEVALVSGSLPLRLTSESAGIKGALFETGVEGTSGQGFEVQSSTDLANWSRIVSGWFGQGATPFRQTLLGTQTGGMRFFRAREKDVEARVGNDLVDGTYEVAVDGGRVGERYVVERQDGAGPWVPLTTNVVQGAEFFLHDRFPAGGQRPHYRVIRVGR